MLDCEHVQQQLSDYVDKALPWHRRLAIWLHLRMCDVCAGVERSLRRAIFTLGQLRDLPLDEEPTSHTDH